MTDARSIAARPPAALAMRRAVAIVAGALLVTLGAQVAIPVPGTVVPLTLQVPAVLIVGGLLGPALGPTSLAFYLAMGMAGLPVFAAGGVPGVARLLGPTGGYLLAYPVAAAVVGRVLPGGGTFRLVVALVLATVTIHAGGVAQLAILDGDMAIALRVGSLPFLAGDLVKLTFAGLVIHRSAPSTRRALR